MFLSWSHVLWHPLFLTIRACLGIDYSVALAHSLCVLLSFSFSVRGSSTEMTFLSTCTNIRCVTCVSMRLDLPSHFVLWFYGTCRLTLSPTSYSGRARSSIEKIDCASPPPLIECSAKATLVNHVTPSERFSPAHTMAAVTTVSACTPPVW